MAILCKNFIMIGLVVLITIGDRCNRVGDVMLQNTRVTAQANTRLQITLLLLLVGYFYYYYYYYYTFQFYPCDGL